MLDMRLFQTAEQEGLRLTVDELRYEIPNTLHSGEHVEPKMYMDTSAELELDSPSGYPPGKGQACCLRFHADGSPP